MCYTVDRSSFIFMMASWCLLLYVLIASSARADDQQVYEESPTVKISQGSLLGAASSTADGSRYYQFLGIPYAKPPLGDLRFAAPEDPESWSGVRNATKYGSTCYQVGEDGGSEDCLFVNVFTPQLPTNGSNTSLLPVMVYIHGGAFVSGSGNMSPGQLLNYGLVVATINYRLNVFGFLSINGTDAPGNAGLKDQSAALRWIQKTIAKFGGDPNNVTIFGASAGGASIHYNILSPLSKGLFHRAISESGSALNPWAFFKNTEARALRLGAILGNKTDSATELLSVLRAASGKDLLTAINHILTAEESERLISNPFVPSLEFPRKGEKPFLPHEPSYLVENGLFNKVPYITGVTKNESLVFVYQQILLDSSYWQDINKDLEQVVPVDLGLVKGSAQSLEVAQKVISFYFGNKTISNETISQWLDLQTDLLFATGVVKTVHAHAKHSTSATYNYQFVYGVALHTMEFSFVTYGGKLQGENNNDVKLARLMGELWTSFAKTGIPSVEGEVVWKNVSKNSFPYLEISPSLSLKNDLEKDRMDFWFGIYKNYSNSTSTLQK